MVKLSVQFLFAGVFHVEYVVLAKWIITQLVIIFNIFISLLYYMNDECYSLL